jgi:hypothetical protein
LFSPPTKSSSFSEHELRMLPSPPCDLQLLRSAPPQWSSKQTLSGNVPYRCCCQDSGENMSDRRDRDYQHERARSRSPPRSNDDRSVSSSFAAATLSTQHFGQHQTDRDRDRGRDDRGRDRESDRFVCYVTRFLLFLHKPTDIKLIAAGRSVQATTTEAGEAVRQCAAALLLSLPSWDCPALQGQVMHLLLSCFACCVASNL